MQAILLVGLSACLLYALFQRRKSRLISSILILTSLLGMVFVIAPSTTNTIAHFVGIGRGADLILYCWILISLAVSVNLQFKILSLQRNVTELSRAIAVATARSEPNE